MTFLKILGSIILGVVLMFLSAAVCSCVGLTEEDPLYMQICLGIGIGVPAVLIFFIIFLALWDEFFEEFGGVTASIISLVFYIAAVLCLAFIPLVWLAVVIFLVCLVVTCIFKRNSLAMTAEDIDNYDTYDYDVYEVSDSGHKRHVYHGTHTSDTFTTIWFVIQAIIYLVLPLVGRFAFGDEYNWFLMLAPSIILIIGVIVSIVKRGHDNYYDNL